MMHDIAAKALTAWAMEVADLSLVAQRENVVFRVTAHDNSRYALRLHRPGYQTAGMMQSELAWIQHLKAEGLHVPAPVPTQSGAILIDVAGYHADLLTWLNGTPMGSTGTALHLADRTGTFRKLGRLMAQVHRISDAWDKPDGFVRQHWDIDGLLGDAPLWGRFWDNPGLSTNQRDRILRARDLLRDELDAQPLDFGLIHADMLRENVLIDGQNLGLIDFDDSGFGFRLFDVATALFKNRDEPDYEALQNSFLSGYQEVRPLDTTFLPHFMLIRALSYLGWIIARMDEPGAKTRQTRFLSSALPMIDHYLAHRQSTERVQHGSDKR